MSIYDRAEDRVCTVCGAAFRSRRERTKCRRCERGTARTDGERLLHAELRRILRRERDPARRVEVAGVFLDAIERIREQQLAERERRRAEGVR